MHVCGVVLERDADYTVYLNGPGENVLSVPVAIINSITSIKVTDGDQNVLSTFDATDYHADPQAPGIVRLKPNTGAIQHVADLHGPNQRNTWAPFSVFPKGFENIEFKGDVGYANVPEDLKAAVWLLMSASLSMLGRDPGVASVNMGTVGASFRSPAESRAAAFELARPWRPVA